MTYGSSIWLAVAAVILVAGIGLAFKVRTSKRSRIATILKTLSLCSIAVALAEPEWNFAQGHVALIALADTSHSISGSGLQAENQLLDKMNSLRGGNQLIVLPFAAQPLSLKPEQVSRQFRITSAEGAHGAATSLEAALTRAVDLVPANYQGRIALLSDGNENEGSSARAIAELWRLGIPVDTYSIGKAAGQQLTLESVAYPQEAFSGERVPVELTITSPAKGEGTVSLQAEGKTLGTSPVHLNQGTNHVQLEARIQYAGATVLEGAVHAGNLGDVYFRQALVLTRPKVLLVSNDPPGSDINLANALQQASYEITRATALPSELDPFQLVILNNLDLNTIPLPDKVRVEKYVQAGGGLLLLGGERQVYKERNAMDALDRTLPADLAPPKAPEGTCVVLIVDKSSSMEGRKIELARLSAVGVVDHMRPTDQIGVLIFDNSYQWAVPLRKAEDKVLIKRLIAGITPDGGTQIAPALTEAYRRISAAKSTVKHIVLLTDGISEEGDSLDLAKEASSHSITISTVGLGQDVNRSYLEKVADISGGKSYFLNEPAGLEQILLKDVKDFSGSTAVERSLQAIVVHPANILNGVATQTAPPLKGYTRFTAKPDADVVLQIEPEMKDPLYVRWQYGLGRAAVFASDAKSRWAERWIGWPGFDSFWINATRDLLSHTSPVQATAQFDPATGEIAASYKIIGAVGPKKVRPPKIYVLGPNGFRKAMELRAGADNLWTGAVTASDAHGLFRLTTADQNSLFPELGVYRGEEEMEQRGVNERVLRQIAGMTGGRFNPEPQDAFQYFGVPPRVTIRLWPLLISLAIGLALAELITRKWLAISARFRPASPAPA